MRISIKLVLIAVTAGLLCVSSISTAVAQSARQTAPGPGIRARRPGKSPIALEAARQKNGALKAMLFIDRNGQIARCFNSLLDEGAGSQLPCGFKVERFSTDSALKVDFGFQVNDRFVLTTPVIAGARFQPESASANTTPLTFHPDESSAIVVLLSRPETGVMIFVY